MANKTIAQLTALSTSPATADLLPLWDSSESATKYVTVAELLATTHTHTPAQIVSGGTTGYVLFDNGATPAWSNAPTITSLVASSGLQVGSATDVTIGTSIIQLGNSVLKLTQDGFTRMGGSNFRYLKTSGGAYGFSLGGNTGIQFDVGGSGLAYLSSTGLGVGVQASTPLHVAKSDSATSTAVEIGRLDAQSTGTPLGGFGARLSMVGQSSTTTGQNMANIQTVWITATHASRAAKLVLQAADQSGWVNFLELKTDGSGGGVIDTYQIQNHMGTMTNSTKDPTTDAPIDWVEIKIGGVQGFIPVYAA